MHRGYIKIWRRIQDSFLNSNSELFHLWINLLLLASHKDTEFIFNGKKTVIKGGQFITGRQSLSLLTGIHESKIYRLLHILENEHLIEQQKTNLYTIVSIVNYSQYQENEQQSEQQMNNQRTTSEQPVNTINHKEAQINTKKKYVGHFVPPTIENVKTYCSERKNTVDPNKWHSWYTANGWKVGKNPMKDWKACVRTWENEKSTAPNWSRPEGKL